MCMYLIHNEISGLFDESSNIGKYIWLLSDLCLILQFTERQTKTESLATSADFIEVSFEYCWLSSDCLDPLFDIFALQAEYKGTHFTIIDNLMLSQRIRLAKSQTQFLLFNMM